MNGTKSILPAYRLGELYTSLTHVPIKDCTDGTTVGVVGQVNAGVIRRDLRRLPACFERLQQHSIAEMVDVCQRAAALFLSADLVGCDGTIESRADYVRKLSATGGLPQALVAANMEKIAFVLREVEFVIHGLTRNLDLRVVEQGLLEQPGGLLSFLPTTHGLGAVLPSNSPGVNSLWIPAVALRIPVLLKPGKQDPWTPWRIINALLAAGCPQEAFGFYPTDHEGANVLTEACGRVIVFGDARTIARYAGDPRISCHGPGYSKIILGEDCIDHWESYVELLADSILRNSGRSCVNASTILVPRHGAALADALAERAAQIQPRPLDDPQAKLAGFTNHAWAQAIHNSIDQALRRPGASDRSAEFRQGDRLVDLQGISYLQPTIVHCADSAHPLARTEYMFPFASVVEVPQAEVCSWIGPSLVVSAVTDDPAFRRELLRCTEINRLNLGPIPTPQVSWNQPHEGNLFEFLYARRAIQEAPCNDIRT